MIFVFRFIHVSYWFLKASVRHYFFSESSTLDGQYLFFIVHVFHLILKQELLRFFMPIKAKAVFLCTIFLIDVFQKNISFYDNFSCLLDFMILSFSSQVTLTAIISNKYGVFPLIKRQRLNCCIMGLWHPTNMKFHVYWAP